ncbi:tungsten formylmethanofuran dehydrogenase [Phyllobacterium myrsinacearum]|uniref:Formylmethanofuran dehydrogenase subunit B n=1 Tax=Phyllobacterium myrsinacearum TaxID=28101 RepID=A0A839EY31_9HYPH|nr:tungsten formylmethanofuran dehydrogenase [Phyllobacterium myrsinacearum]MBA8881400.1 formylmethanofuran dehydrogenase subunit B [Phyllobacterium myrsinacearum]
MSVAWIGSQPVSLTDAIQNAAKLLASSRCPVFTFDADVHGTRSTIALATMLGGAYDHASGQVLANEVALFTNHGGMFTTPGEARRRSSLIILVGEIPTLHHDLLQAWASSKPDLGDKRSRSWFHVGGAETDPSNGKLLRQLKAISLRSEGLSLNAELAVLRAQLQGRQALVSLSNIAQLKKALAAAQFPVFVFSGSSVATAGLVMLQELIVDLNIRGRASSVFLPADDDAWGSALTSLWMTGFPPRTGFTNSLPSYDPVLWDVQRMINEKEADLHVWVSTRGGQIPPKGGQAALISLNRTEVPTGGAAVTIAVGQAGMDHDGVTYSSRIGTFRTLQATAASHLPSASKVISQLAEALPGKRILAC